MLLHQEIQPEAGLLLILRQPTSLLLGFLLFRFQACCQKGPPSRLARLLQRSFPRRPQVRRPMALRQVEREVVRLEDRRVDQ